MSSPEGTQWVMMELHKGVQDTLGIPCPPVPVPADQADGMPQTDLDPGTLLEHIETYAADDEEMRGAYARLAPTLAYIHGIHQGEQGQHVEAARTFRRGLAFDPHNLRLHANLQVALAAAGAPEAAIETGLAIIAQPDVAPHGPVWVLTAKLLIQAGRADRAVEVLAELLPSSPNDPIFWALWERALDDAGIEADDVPVPAPRVES